MKVGEGHGGFAVALLVVVTGCTIVFQARYRVR
jgi:hypothetical protein